MNELKHFYIRSNSILSNFVTPVLAWQTYAFFEVIWEKIYNNGFSSPIACNRSKVPHVYRPCISDSTEFRILAHEKCQPILATHAKLFLVSPESSWCVHIP